MILSPDDFARIPSWRAVVMSDSGIGKSTFLATMPKPQLVLGFDPAGKFGPYRVGRKVGGTVYGDVGQLVTPIEGHDGLIQLENFIDENPKQPHAFRDFLARIAGIYDEVRAGRWASVVLDTVTFMQIAIRNQLKTQTSDDKFVNIGVTDECESILCGTMAAMLCHVGIAAHIDKDKDEILPGEFARGPSAPGRLGKRDGLRATYSEVYRLYMERLDDDSWVRVLQTTPRDGFACATSPEIQAPDGIAWAKRQDVNWNDIWKNWKQENE